MGLPLWPGDSSICFVLIFPILLLTIHAFINIYFCSIFYNKLRVPEYLNYFTYFIFAEIHSKVAIILSDSLFQLKDCNIELWVSIYLIEFRIKYLFDFVKIPDPVTQCREKFHINCLLLFLQIIAVMRTSHDYIFLN